MEELQRADECAWRREEKRRMRAEKRLLGENPGKEGGGGLTMEEGEGGKEGGRGDCNTQATGSAAGQ